MSNPIHAKNPSGSRCALRRARLSLIAFSFILFFSAATRAAAPVITSATMASGTVGSAFSYQITATGAPRSYKAAGLPAGLTVNTKTGLISGTPTVAGTSTVTLSVTSRRGTGKATLTLTITGGTPSALVISTTSLPTGTVGQAYSARLTASGGTTPYTWALASGEAPAGVVLSASGVLSGTPTVAGSSSFTVQVTDAANNTTTQPLSISIAAATAPNTLVTSDSLLNTGAPASVTYTAPATNSNIAIITSKSNSSAYLWEFYPDPFNIQSGSGTITMGYSGTGSIVETVNLSGLDSHGVNAYPFIFYGADEWGDQILGQPPQFPAQLSAMSSLTVDVAYALSGTFGSDIDILFDQWLIPSATYADGPGGAVEVEVLPYYNFAEADGVPLVKTFTEPVTVNGTTTDIVFDEYSTGTGAGNVVLFSPASGLGVISGEVQFNMLDFLNEGAATAGLDSSWWNAGLELGTEFGDGAVENFTFTVQKLEIEQTMAAGSSTP